MTKVIDSTNLGHLIGKIRAAFWAKGDTSELAIDNEPTPNSGNLVTSGGVYAFTASPYKGIFPTSSALNTAYPSPEDGDYAYVKAGTALHIYTALNGSWSDTGIEASAGLENVFTNGAKMTLLSVLEKVAWIDSDGQAYIDNLRNALLGSVEVESITAVFAPGTAVILDTMTLDDLKQYLTVTAEFSDGTTGEIVGYTLSGSMDPGTNTITVTYDELTDTFSATVLHNYAGALNNWIYHPNNAGGTAAYSDGKIRLKCGNASDVSNWSVWVADGKKTLWSAVEHKSVKVRIKVNANDYVNIGAFGMGIYQNANINSMGAAYALRAGFGAEGTWVLADDGYYETVTPFVCEQSSFTSGTLSPGSASTFGIWCYSRSTSQYQEIYDVQVFEVTP